MVWYDETGCEVAQHEAPAHTGVTLTVMPAFLLDGSTLSEEMETPRYTTRITTYETTIVRLAGQCRDLINSRPSYRM